MSNFFTKLFDNVGKIGQHGDSVVGVDIGTSSAKVVQLKKKSGKATLETYGEIALGPYAGLSVGQAATLTTEKTVEALKDLFRESNVTASYASFALPLRSSLLTVIELPSYKEEQINSMIPMEARKHIPVPISEVTLDWWIIPRHDFQSPDQDNGSTSFDNVHDKSLTTTNKTSVLLVAIHKAALKRFQDIAIALKLNSRAYEIETFSAIRAVLSRDTSAIALLDVGASTSKLTIIDFGVVRVSHVINHGSQEVSLGLAASISMPFIDGEKKKRKEGLNAPGAAGSIMDNIFYEAQNVLEEWERKYARSVSKIVCVGGGSLILGFVDLASKHFKCDIKLGNPFEKVDTPAFMAPILSGAGPEFAVALGLALHELEEV